MPVPCSLQAWQKHESSLVSGVCEALDQGGDVLFVEGVQEDALLCINGHVLGVQKRSQNLQGSLLQAPRTTLLQRPVEAERSHEVHDHDRIHSDQ